MLANLHHNNGIYMQGIPLCADVYVYTYIATATVTRYRKMSPATSLHRIKVNLKQLLNKFYNFPVTAADMYVRIIKSS